MDIPLGMGMEVEATEETRMDMFAFVATLSRRFVVFHCYRYRYLLLLGG